MAREESSVMSSLQQLMVDEEQRRAEQVKLAYRRKLEQERKHFEQEQRRAEKEQQRAEAAKHLALQQAAGERAERELQARERSFELERVRSDLELRTRATIMQTEQQHELERLQIARGQRVAKLEGQRIIISTLLGTTSVGLLALYIAIVRPESKRQLEAIAHLTQVTREQHDEHDSARKQFESKIQILESHVTLLESKLKGATKVTTEPSSRNHSSNDSRAPNTLRPAVKAETCIDDNDPLCGNLKPR